MFKRKSVPFVVSALLALSTISLVSTSVVACGEVETQEVILNITTGSFTLVEGETAQIGVTVTGTDNTAVTYEVSEGSDVVSVSESGLITAIAKGSATIKVTSVADTSKFGTVEITVEEKGIAVTSLTISDDDFGLEKGESKKLSATAAPDDATDKTITWSSDTTSVATVDSTGLVTAVGVGEATITATCGKVSDTVIVTVYSHAEGIEITTSEEDAKIFIGATKQVEYAIDPIDATDEVVWTTSDEAVATVDETGLVTGVANGSATITVTSNEKTDSIVFNVYPELFDKEEGTTYRYYDELSDSPSVVSGASDGVSDVETLPLNVDASTTYFMEVDVSLDYEPWVDSAIAGLANFADDFFLNDIPYYGVGVSNAFANQFDWAHKWGNVITFTNEINVTDYTRQYSVLNNYNVPSYDLSVIGSSVKLATARVGDTFYSFVNGIYMQSGIVEALSGIPTKPGFMSLYTNVKYQDIDYLAGEDAINKLASLGQSDVSNLLRYEKRYDDSETQAIYGDTIKFDETDGLTFTSQSTVGMNSSLLTPDLSIFGDGYVEATYSDFALNDASSTGNVGICIRNRDWAQMTMGRFVISANNNDLNDLKIQVAWGDQNWETVNILDDVTSFDASQGIKERIERRIGDLGSDFTITWTSVAKPEQTYTVTYTYSVTDYDYCYNQFAFQFFSEQTKVKASNVSWGTLSD
jgi:uncharacterized protein YjdB